VQAAMNTMDGIVDTVSAVHPILPLIGLLKSHGKLVMLGAPDKPLELPVFPLLLGNFIYKTNDKFCHCYIYIYIYVGFLFYFIDLKVFVKTGRKMVVGSALGGMKETQEMIEFAAKHNITADIEVISMEYVNTAMERLAKGDVRYRFVIDVGNTLAATKP
jgi:D-arabinose 1-dehydrogenase-like Zn-dependent alcohol dehydrogenase